MLDRSHWHIVIHPAGCAGLAESVQDEVLTDGVRFTRYLHLPFVITAFRDGGLTVAAIEAGTFGNGLQFTQEMVLWISLLIDEDPALIRRFLSPFPQQLNQGAR